MPLGIIGPRIAQAASDLLDVACRCFYAAFRFLLEGVQHVNRIRETHGTDGAISVPVEILDEFDNRTPKPLKWLGRWRMLAGLRQVDFEAEIFLHARRKRPIILLARSNPEQRLQRAGGGRISKML